MNEQATETTSDTMNPNNATGAADAMTPPGSSEYDANPLDYVDDRLDVETHAVQPTPAPVPVITGEFINMTIRSLRAPFDAKKKRGAEFKGARARLDKRADQAVREFRAMYLPEISDEQALRISLGITGLVGDSMRGFTYVDSSEE